jgi:hypothetical protein
MRPWDAWAAILLAVLATTSIVVGRVVLLVHEFLLLLRLHEHCDAIHSLARLPDEGHLLLGDLDLLNLVSS